MMLVLVYIKGQPSKTEETKTYSSSKVDNTFASYITTLLSAALCVCVIKISIKINLFLRH